MTGYYLKEESYIERILSDRYTNVINDTEMETRKLCRYIIVMGQMKLGYYR